MEHHAWQDAGLFEPESRTASAITGAITLSGNAEFAVPGSVMTMSFGNGRQVKLTSVGASWRKWTVVDDANYTAEVFQLEQDPGELLNGNRLCGGKEDGSSLYAVFVEQGVPGLPPSLGMAVFQSLEPPKDIDSPGLCGTFSYTISVDKKAHTLGESIQAPTDQGKWLMSKRANPIDDTLTVTLSLTAEEGVSTLGEPVTFVARCKSNVTEAYAIWGEYLGSNAPSDQADVKNIVVRIGTSPAMTEKWAVSTDRTATFAPDWAGDLLKELLGQERLVLQTTPYGESPITAVFDVTGLKDQLGPLAEACNWSF